MIKKYDKRAVNQSEERTSDFFYFIFHVLYDWKTGVRAKWHGA